MHGLSRNRDLSPVAGNPRIYPMIIDIRIEAFEPRSGTRKAYSIIVVCSLAQACNDDRVPAEALQPAVNSYYTVFVIYVKHASICAAQRRMTPASSYRFSCEAQMIDHRLVAERQAVPPNVKRRAWHIPPLFILQKFLSHKDLGNSGREEQKTGRNAVSAAGVP